MKEEKNIEIADEKCFIGFDSFEKVLDSGVDIVLLCTPPHFRPAHVEAAIMARKHIFMEKPCAVDPVGVRSILASAKKAEALGLSIVSGTIWRVQKNYMETQRHVANGEIGETAPIAYVHGELFGVGGVETIPDNPRGKRSKSIENRCKGKGEWNTYEVICVDGTIKLSVNGKFVNGISKSSKKKGFICLESEGAEIHFRNIKIISLP